MPESRNEEEKGTGDAAFVHRNQPAWAGSFTSDSDPAPGAVRCDGGTKSVSDGGKCGRGEGHQCDGGICHQRAIQYGGKNAARAVYVGESRAEDSSVFAVGKGYGGASMAGSTGGL